MFLQVQNKFEPVQIFFGSDQNLFGKDQKEDFKQWKVVYLAKPKIVMNDSKYLDLQADMEENL